MAKSSRKNAKKTPWEPTPLKVFLYCYTLGKEELFDALARHFNCKVQLLLDRWRK